jgi:seryl-tRNA synthetase
VPAIAEFEAKRAEQKQLGKQIPQAQGDEKAALLARTKELAAEVKAPRPPGRGRGRVASDADGRSPTSPPTRRRPAARTTTSCSRHVGTPRDFDFEPRDHLELGKLLGAIDTERGAKVSGARFYFLTGVGAQLELALLNLAMEQARGAGFTQVIAPALVKPEAMEGTGFLGQAADDVYRIEDGPLPRRHVGGAARGVPLRRDPRRRPLPLRYAAFSPCFRKEAGSHGKDTRASSGCTGSTRSRCSSTPTRGVAAEHQRLLEWEKEFLDKLELPYRVIDVAAGDLGLSAAPQVRLRGVDPDAGQVPRADLDLELHRLPDPPARHPRPDARRRRGTRPVATLNGTLCAITRTIVAILETHQQADGSVRVPKALRPTSAASRRPRAGRRLRPHRDPEPPASSSRPVAR